jgi:UDP-N-acetyl-D-mannosaminuronic acid dehydrogenase
MRAVVVALGKVGLPIAAQIARAGHEVVGCDIDPRVVELVNRGEPPFPGEDGLAEALAEVVADGRLRAQADTTAAVADGADLVIAVPPLVVDTDARPDWSILDAVIADVGAGLRAGTTVAVETTVPVGTTRSRIARSWRGAAASRPRRSSSASSAPSGCTAGASSATWRPIPSSSAG